MPDAWHSGTLNLCVASHLMNVRFDIMDNDHDLGSYSTIGVSYDYGYPQDYISKAEETLEVFNASVDWYKLRLHYEKIAFRECEEEEEGF